MKMITILLLSFLMLDSSAVADDDPTFSFLVMDRFKVSNAEYDLVITGQVKVGTIVANAYACVTGSDSEPVAIEIIAISKTGKLVETATKGDLVGLGTTGATKELVEPGDRITPGCEPS